MKLNSSVLAVLCKKPFSIFSNSLWLAIILLVIQQLIVASSTIWLTRLITHITEGNPSLIWLWLYLTSLIIPYIPGAFALIHMAKAQAKAVVHYMQAFAERYQGRVFEWSNSLHKTNKTSILSGEVYLNITNYIEYFYHLFASLLNVMLNICVLIFFVDSSFLFSYSIGIALAVLILYSQKNVKKVRAIEAQQSRIQWISILMRAWDNVLLKNAYNLKIWNRKISKHGLELENTTVRLEKFSQLVSVCMAFSLIMPTLSLVIYLAYSHISDMSFLALLVVVLPRIFQVLTYSYELLFSLSDLPMQKAKLKTIVSLVSDDEDEVNIIDRIDWEKIKASTRNSSGAENAVLPRTLLNELPKTGRITISGDNGSGKTSFLLSLKRKYGKTAFYLPAKHDLFFTYENMHSSTGQLSRQILTEIKNHVTVPIILLDEWDANLDHKNKKEISLLIDELARHQCVLEILHAKQ